MEMGLPLPGRGWQGCSHALFSWWLQSNDSLSGNPTGEMDLMSHCVHSPVRSYWLEEPQVRPPTRPRLQRTWKDQRSHCSTPRKVKDNSNTYSSS